MATAALRRAVTAMTRRPSDPPDADLLRRFTADRSEDAFAALVRRHGPLVLGVCRRVVPDAHLADDAFQAAFVVLARRAGGIDPARPLGPWLYGVAHRVALRARTMIGRRRKRETLAATVPEVPHPPAVVDDAAAVLDEEISKLPAASRDAVILCELQGLSRRDAAARLGIAEGTLSSRLAAARKTLAVRLQSRGVVLSVALAAAAAVPPDLVAATVAAGIGVSLSSVVVSLADGASAMTLLNKLKLATVAAVFALSALGYGLWPTGETAAAPVPKAKPDAGLIWTFDPATRELTAHTPEGKEARKVKLADKAFDPTHFLGITADGQRAMLAVRTGVALHDEDTDPRGTPVFTVHLLPLHEAGKPTDTGIDYAAARGRTADTLTTSADGQFVYRCREVSKEGAERGTWAVTRFDLTGKNPKEIALPDHTRLTAVLPDGDFLLEEYISGWERQTPAYRWTPGDEKPVLVSGEVNVHAPTLSPDGKTLLATAQHLKSTAPPDGEFRKLVGIDPATGKATDVVAREKTGSVAGWWSPDGKRIAVQWHEWVDAVPKTLDGGLRFRRTGGGEVSVCNPDGTADKVILKLDDPGDDGPAATDLRHRKHLVGWFPAQKIKAPVPKAKPDAGLIWTHNTKTNLLTAYTPDGEVAREVQLPEGVPFFGFTPDGSKMAFGGTKGKGAKAGDGLTLHVGDITEKCEGTDTGVTCKPGDLFAWSPDAKRVVRGTKVVQWTTEWTHTLHDLGAKTDERVKLPRDHQLLQWSADGKTWLVLHNNHGKDGNLPFYRWLTTPAGEKVDLTPVCDTCSFVALDPHPDGTRLLGVGHDHPFASKPGEMHLFSVADGKATRLASVMGLAVGAARWSPDGKRIACLKHPFDEKRKEPVLFDTALVLFDADGTNEVTLHAAKGDSQTTRLLGWFPTQKVKAPPPKVKDEGLIWTYERGLNNLIAYAPDGKKVRKVYLPDRMKFIGLMPDGTRVMFAGKKGKLPALLDTKGLTLHVGPIGETGEGTDTGLGWESNDHFAWSPDGKQVVRARTDAGALAKSGKFEFSNVLYDLTTRKETKLDLPADHKLVQWSADGKSWRVLHQNLWENPKLPEHRWLTTPVGDKPDLKPLCDTHSFLWLDPHPDGNGYLGVGVKHDKTENTTGYELFRVIDDKVESMIKLSTPYPMMYARYSPDGKRAVCLKREAGKKENGRLTSLFGGSVWTVFDADGKNETKLFARTDDNGGTQLLGWFPTPPPEKKDDPKAKPVKEPIKAPVPLVKAKPPVKLDRVPDARAELQKELAGWDSTYRHQSEEKFAELEKRAEELTKEQTDKHDEARIWYAVAHIAAQSDIRKHADRVRKYADKCLKVSRDPLDRSYLYSYLASCEELSKGEPAARRQKATDWLLTGYLELLAQELPDAKPELPGVGKFRIDGDGAEAAQARAKHAAQMAAREQAKWVADQIARRDVLVMHFRNLYPRDADDLRKPAEAKLPKADDVDKLLERVQPKK